MDFTITAEMLELHAEWWQGNTKGRRLVVPQGARVMDVGLDGDVGLGGACLKGAVLAGISLSCHSLERANLEGADLSGTNLAGADLWQANLRNANLRGASLERASLRKADLRGACLREAGLSRAQLCDANLEGAQLDIHPDAPHRLREVAIHALQPNALQMSRWHSCDTTHCIAGWAIHLAGEAGAELEDSHGPAIAGLLLLGTEAYAHFYDSDEDATAYLQSVLSR